MVELQRRWQRFNEDSGPTICNSSQKIRITRWLSGERLFTEERIAKAVNRRYLCLFPFPKFGVRGWASLLKVGLRPLVCVAR